jgi:hypothetical protein
VRDALRASGAAAAGDAGHGAAGERHAAVNGVRRNLSKGQRAMAVAKMLPDPENSRPHQSFTSV